MKTKTIISSIIAFFFLLSVVLLASACSSDFQAKNVAKQYVSAYFGPNIRLMEKISFINYQTMIANRYPDKELTSEQAFLSFVGCNSMDEYYERTDTRWKGELFMRYGEFKYSVDRVEIKSYSLEDIKAARKGTWKDYNEKYNIDLLQIDEACEATVMIKMENQDGVKYLIANMTMFRYQGNWKVDNFTIDG